MLISAIGLCTGSLHQRFYQPDLLVLSSQRHRYALVCALVPLLLAFSLSSILFSFFHTHTPSRSLDLPLLAAGSRFAVVHRRRRPLAAGMHFSRQPAVQGEESRSFAAQERRGNRREKMCREKFLIMLLCTWL
jgi:hypothetical protein